MTEPRDLYKVLQVDPEADPDVVRAAFRSLAKKHHPDSDGGREDVMAALNGAWAILGDPAKRAAYDLERAARLAQGTGGPAGLRDRGTRGSTSGGMRHSSGPSHGSPSPPAGPGYKSAAPGAPGDGNRAPRSRPAGRPTGSVLDFGRYEGWSLDELARHDPVFLEWLARTPIGRRYRPEIDALLAARAPVPTPARPSRPARSGRLFGRR